MSKTRVYTDMKYFSPTSTDLNLTRIADWYEDMASLSPAAVEVVASVICGWKSGKDDGELGVARLIAMTRLSRVVCFGVGTSHSEMPAGCQARCRL